MTEIVFDRPYMIVNLQKKSIVYGAAGRTAAEAWQMFTENDCLGTAMTKDQARRMGWVAKKVKIVVGD